MKGEKRKVILKEKKVEIPLAKEELEVVGKQVIRKDGYEKVTGRLKFGADFDKAGFLHGKVLRSPHAHALIKKVDVEKAKALPGVVAILTAEDVPGRNGFGAIIPDQPVICGEKVRFIGDGVALVAAESEEAAIEALKLIDVEYEPLSAVFSPVEAMKPGAPKVHENGNLLTTVRIRKGDTEKGFQEAEVIVEQTYSLPFVEHAYMEPDVAMAIPHEDGTITVKGPMQAPFTVRRNIAPVLHIPISKVQCVQTHLGGGFGGKEDSSIDIGVRAALLAWKTKRPVRMEYEREEVTLSTAKRHPMIIQCKVGAKRDGTLTALEGTIYNEQGAYASLGPIIPPAGGTHAHAVIMLPGPYVIPHVKVDGYLVYTNHPYGGAMRGFGAPQVNFVHESIIDELAEALQMNPYDLRMKNCFELGSVTATGQVLDQSIALKETMRSAADQFEWFKRWRPPPSKEEVEKVEKRRGVGMAIGWYRTSIGTFSDGCGANVYVHEDGSVILHTGITEMGQGSHTVLAQIAAEELGVRIEDVRIVVPDTDIVPEAGPTVGSRSTTLMGNAIIMASQAVKASILEAASEILGVPAERLVARNRLIFDRDDQTRGVEFKEAARRALATGKRMMGQGWWAPPRPSFDVETGQGYPYFVYTYNTQMAEVEVDTKTGHVEVIKVVACFDIGRAINPILVEGQIEGGIMMGLGYAMMEEVLLKEGKVQNLNFQDYMIPTAMDAPEIVPMILEDPNRYGPFGAKGIGEMPNIPTAPAIINAVANAVGVRIRDLPAHSEKVFHAMRGRRG
ncbi:MAG: xanthine dehydrogenase family protein [Syntrophaceae bacterium]|nr:xanthine dehydrogenase family protein [Syntrophaceae bacterium]